MSAEHDMHEDAAIEPVPCEGSVFDDEVPEDELPDEELGIRVVSAEEMEPASVIADMPATPTEAPRRHRD